MTSLVSRDHWLRYMPILLGKTDTDHSKHAQEISRELSLEFDAVVILSGDGLAHEVFNGFAEHSDPKGAFSIPIAPIPSGSANGTCLSLLGVKVHTSAPLPLVFTPY